MGGGPGGGTTRSPLKVCVQQVHDTSKFPAVSVGSNTRRMPSSSMNSPEK
jgi:hypothetical protein